MADVLSSAILKRIADRVAQQVEAEGAPTFPGAPRALTSGEAEALGVAEAARLVRGSESGAEPPG